MGKTIPRNTNQPRKKMMTVIIAAVSIFAVLALAAILFKVTAEKRAPMPNMGPIPVAGTIFGGVLLPAHESPAEAQIINWTRPAPAEANGAPGGAVAAKEGAPMNVIIYLDPNCNHCADFEENYASMLKAKVDAGIITMETRSVAFLDIASPTNYSSRAANAMACVANAAPEKYLSYTAALFAKRATGELANKQLASLATEVGVPGLEPCISNGTFRPFVKATTEAATFHGVTATPSIFIDGKPFQLGEDLEAAVTPTVNKK